MDEQEILKRHYAEMGRKGGLGASERKRKALAKLARKPRPNARGAKHWKVKRKEQNEPQI